MGGEHNGGGITALYGTIRTIAINGTPRKRKETTNARNDLKNATTINDKQRRRRRPGAKTTWQYAKTNPIGRTRGSPRPISLGAIVKKQPRRQGLPASVMTGKPPHQLSSTFLPHPRLSTSSNMLCADLATKAKFCRA